MTTQTPDALTAVAERGQQSVRKTWIAPAISLLNAGDAELGAFPNGPEGLAKGS
jgi:hypothetical protein